MRPGTLALIILLLIGILAFGTFLVMYDDGSEPPRPLPTPVAP